MILLAAPGHATPPQSASYRLNQGSVQATASRAQSENYGVVLIGGSGEPMGVMVSESWYSGGGPVPGSEPGPGGGTHIFGNGFEATQ